jgi:hypothetical protein
MRQRIGLAAVAGMASILAGCASGPARPTQTSIPRQPTLSVAGPAASLPRADTLIGHTASALVSLMGQPALDVREGGARKLQFLGTTCVLDAYLYPPASRGEPVVTHVDARLPDGRDTDRDACAAALRRR